MNNENDSLETIHIRGIAGFTPVRRTLAAATAEDAPEDDAPPKKDKPDSEAPAPAKDDGPTREEAIGFLRDLASDPNAPPDNRERAKSMLEELAKKSSLAREAVARVAQRTALAQRMGIQSRGGVINRGVHQTFVYGSK